MISKALRMLGLARNRSNSAVTSPVSVPDYSDNNACGYALQGPHSIVRCESRRIHDNNFASVNEDAS